MQPPRSESTDSGASKAWFARWGARVHALMRRHSVVRYAVVHEDHAARDRAALRHLANHLDGMQATDTFDFHPNLFADSRDAIR